MPTIAELLTKGCHFCGAKLPPEQALVATVSYALAGVENPRWTRTLIVAVCPSCHERESAKEAAHAPP